MEDYQERVVTEKAELDKKMKGLFAFLGSKPFLNLAGDEQERLMQQYSAMKRYSDILGERIEAF